MTAPPTARVWVVDLDDPGAPAEASLRDEVSESDWSRAVSISTELGRRRWLLARFATRALVAAALGQPARGVEFVRTAEGKPEVRGGSPRFSVSHSAGLAVIAVSAYAAVGVDVERRRAGLREEAILARVVGARAVSRWAQSPEGERTGVFFDEWVRFEACVKCRGSTLAGSFGADVATGLWVSRVDVGPGYAAAVASADAAPLENVRFAWD